MKPKKKMYLIGFSHDVKSKYMWQNSDNKCSALTLEQYEQPNPTQARQAIKASNPSFQFKNLEVVSITDMGLSRVKMPNKNIINTLNISNMKNELGFDELVDEIVDGVELGFFLGDTFSDGFQLVPDSLAVISQAKNIEELYTDFPKAFAELKDLTAEESALAFAAISERLNVEQGSIKEIIESAIGLIQRTFALSSDIIRFAKQFKKETA